jgi:hypothetical protein
MARLGTTNDDAFVERAMIRINQVKPNFVPTVVWTNPDRRAQQTDRSHSSRAK